MDDFDWHGGAITRATPVTPSYRSTQNVRRFLDAECGAGFKFDRPFMQSIEDGTPKTMGAVAVEWRRRQGDAPVMYDASTLPVPIGAEIVPARELGGRRVIGGIASETESITAKNQFPMSDDLSRSEYEALLRQDFTTFIAETTAFGQCAVADLSRNPG